MRRDKRQDSTILPLYTHWQCGSRANLNPKRRGRPQRCAAGSRLAKGGSERPQLPVRKSRSLFHTPRAETSPCQSNGPALTVPRLRVLWIALEINMGCSISLAAAACVSCIRRLSTHARVTLFSWQLELWGKEEEAQHLGELWHGPRRAKQVLSFFRPYRFGLHLQASQRAHPGNCQMLHPYPGQKRVDPLSASGHS